MDFAKHLRKSEVDYGLLLCKVYYGRFLRNGFHERYYHINKSRCDVQYLEVCQPQFIGREINMEFDD